jgi:DNA replication licensing factor MCM5
MCKDCSNTKQIEVRPGFGGVEIPRGCEGGGGVPGEKKCSLDPWYIIPEKSAFMDQQSLKLQESPESVPTGEMPRNVILSCDRTLCNQIKPGTRVTVTGILSVFQQKGGANKKATAGAVAVRNSYIRVIGIAEDKDAGAANSTFTREEEERFTAMAHGPDIYGKLVRSIAPSIFGQEDTCVLGPPLFWVCSITTHVLLRLLSFKKFIPAKEPMRRSIPV